MSRDRTLLVVLAAMTAVAVYLSYQIIAPFLAAIVWAITLAVVIHPAYRWLNARIRVPNLSAGIAVVLVGATIAAPTIYLIDQVSEEVVRGSELLQSEFGPERVDALLQQHPPLARAVEWLDERLNLERELRRAASELTPRLSSMVSNTLWILTQLVVTLFALFFFLRDSKEALRKTRSLLPLSRRESDYIFRRIRMTIRATIWGTLGIAALKGLLGGIMFWWLEIPGPLLWGAAMAVFSLIPILGAFVVWLPAALILAMMGYWTDATILFIWGALVVSTIDNVLYPVFVGHRLHLHTLAMFFAIMGGLVVFGATGLILGPLVLAVTLALFKIWRDRTRRSVAGEEPVPARPRDVSLRPSA